MNANMPISFYEIGVAVLVSVLLDHLSDIQVMCTVEIPKPITFFISIPKC